MVRWQTFTQCDGGIEGCFVIGGFEFSAHRPSLRCVSACGQRVLSDRLLGNDKLLTRRGDSRQYTIWETFTNTASTAPERFYVVIDEAHRGMRGGRDAEKA